VVARDGVESAAQPNCGSDFSRAAAAAPPPPPPPSPAFVPPSFTLIIRGSSEAAPPLAAPRARDPFTVVGAVTRFRKRATGTGELAFTLSANVVVVPDAGVSELLVLPISTRGSGSVRSFVGEVELPLAELEQTVERELCDRRRAASVAGSIGRKLSVLAGDATFVTGAPAPLLLSRLLLLLPPSRLF
jgi:hypothetical protein